MRWPFFHVVQSIYK